MCDESIWQGGWGSVVRADSEAASGPYHGAIHHCCSHDHLAGGAAGRGNEGSGQLKHPRQPRAPGGVTRGNQTREYPCPPWGCWGPDDTLSRTPARAHRLVACPWPERQSVKRDISAGATHSYSHVAAGVLAASLGSSDCSTWEAKAGTV